MMVYLNMLHGGVLVENANLVGQNVGQVLADADCVLADVGRVLADVAQR